MKIFEKLLDTEKLSKEISQKEYSKYVNSIGIIVNSKCNLGCWENIPRNCNSFIEIPIILFEKIISQLPKTSLIISGSNISPYLKIAIKYDHLVLTKTSIHKNNFQTVECFIPPENNLEEFEPQENIFNTILIFPNLRIKNCSKDIGYIDNTGRLIYTNGHRNKF